jgi:15-cis-phytoene synthase
VKQLFDQVSSSCSKLITRSYSTSFSIGISLLGKKYRAAIYNIYGFVRVADEIVDSFHGFDKEVLLSEFREDTYKALNRKISTNTVLNCFQETVHQYDIPLELIDLFLDSMEMDLSKQSYDQGQYEKYILGSAEVVGLMCLKVFVQGDEAEYQRLKPYAMKLGAAFQKINFLRDLNADYSQLGRVYFPEVNMSEFSDSVKSTLYQDIESDFKDGFTGIKMLPKSTRLGVYVAYVYYYQLFVKIKHTPAEVILRERVRIPRHDKYRLFVTSYLRHVTNML